MSVSDSITPFLAHSKQYNYRKPIKCWVLLAAGWSSTCRCDFVSVAFRSYLVIATSTGIVFTAADSAPFARTYRWRHQSLSSRSRDVSAPLIGKFNYCVLYVIYYSAGGRCNIRGWSADSPQNPTAARNADYDNASLRRTGPPGSLALARWAGWSGVQVGRHVKCWSRSYDVPLTSEGERRERGIKSQRGGQERREWNRGGHRSP